VGFYLRVRRVVPRPSTTPGGSPGLIRSTKLPGKKFGENSPHLLGNIEEGKSEKKSLGEAKHSLGLLVTAFPGTKTHPAIMLLAKLSEEPSPDVACGA
jgi:hypothetical protein